MRFFLFFQSFICFSHLWRGRLCLRTIHGHNYSLECLNDYLYTIRCELNMTSEPRPRDALYWLEFYDEREPFECMLTAQRYSWVCVLDLSTRVEHTFMDTDLFQISLNYSDRGDNGSEVLEKSYMPVDYIRPVPPSNLTLLWEPNQAVFHWSNSYDESVMLVSSLKYRLRILTNGKVWDIQSGVTSVPVPTSTFAPNASYEARVRSAPNENYYKGVWSHWSPTVYWTTEPAEMKNSTGPGDVPYTSFATVCSALFLVPAILLCYLLYTRGKRCVLNPSPAPHIGDFKCSAMLQENASELLQREESLQIASLTEEDGSLGPQPNPTQHVNDGPGRTSSAPGMPHLSVGSKVSMSSWVQVLTSAEKGSVTCSDDYCTLSHTLSEHAVSTHKI